MSRLPSLSSLAQGFFVLFVLLVSITAEAGTFTDAGTALTAPATSGTGNYTVSFDTAAAGTHYLQEKRIVAVGLMWRLMLLI